MIGSKTIQDGIPNGGLHESCCNFEIHKVVPFCKVSIYYTEMLVSTIWYGYIGTDPVILEL